MTGASTIKPNILLAYVTRNDPTSAAGRTASDAWHQFLVNEVGGDGYRNDLEISWLQKIQGATGGNLTDCWQNLLSGSGYTGQLQDMLNQFFSNTTSSPAGGGIHDNVPVSENVKALLLSLINVNNTSAVTENTVAAVV